MFLGLVNLYTFFICMSLAWSVIVLSVYFDVQLLIAGLEIKIYYKEY